MACEVSLRSAGARDRDARRWLVAAAYGALVTADGVLVALGDEWWPLQLAQLASPWLLLPALPLLALAVFSRRRSAAVLLTVPALIFALAFGPLFLPQPPPRGSRRLRVMTYNVHDGGVAPVRLVEIVRVVDADIVGLEELDAAQAAALDNGVADLYPYRVALGQGMNGKGLLSRFPISGAELFTLHAADRPHLRAVVTVDGEPLRVIVAHPHAPAAVPGFWGGLRFQYDPSIPDEIPALAGATTGSRPALLIGDMNFSDGTPPYRVLSASGLRDSYRDAGWGLGRTWPVNLGVPGPPLVRLDYVWHTSDFSTAAARVGPDGGSDHLPVIADLVWHRDPRVGLAVPRVP